MEERSTSRKPGLLPLLCGVAVGMVVVLLGQKVLTSPDGEANEAEVVANPNLEAEMATMRTELEALGRENRRLKGDLAAAARAEGDTVVTAEPSAGEEKAEGGVGEVLKAMMAFGAQDAERKTEAQVQEFAVALGLDEVQQGQVRAALLDRIDKQQGAGLLMMQGKATIADLAAADEDNFVEFDAAMEEILSADQLGEFADYQHQREEKRVEKKVNEELDGLEEIADLTEEEADRAWELLVEINADEKPEEVPADLALEDFDGWIDDAIARRHEALSSLLTTGEQEAYRGQTDAFREMVSALVRGGTGGATE